MIELKKTLFFAFQIFLVSQCLPASSITTNAWSCSESTSLPLLWCSDFDDVAPGGRTLSISGFPEVRRDSAGVSYVSLSAEHFNIFSGLPHGSALGDVVIRFRCRPADIQFKLSFILHDLRGGSRRYRCDRLAKLSMSLSNCGVAASESFDPGSYISIAHMTSEPRFLDSDKPAFPKYPAAVYDNSASFEWEIGRWYDVIMILDGDSFVLTVDGHEFFRRAIHPAAGRMQAALEIGSLDIADVEIREIRPAYDPYLEENLITRERLRIAEAGRERAMERHAAMEAALEEAKGADKGMHSNGEEYEF